VNYTNPYCTALK